MQAIIAAPPPSRLHAAGEALRRHRKAIIAVQWAVALFYLVLVTVPAFQPLPNEADHVYNNLTLFAQFAFWGIWWPFVILSMMIAGRAWCGLLCPEGALTELASRHGLGHPVPRWMKWGGWPFVAFIATTVYGQLVSVYEYPKAVLLILGGSTLAALAVGLVYGKGTRVWCRHLCPVSGVFGLLARLAPVHFRVDRAAWDTAPRAAAMDCAPLVDIRRMKGASQCHMCGKCSGQRNAVSLAARIPGSEIAALSEKEARPWETRLLVFGTLGVAVGAFQWSASPWFVAVKQSLAGWLVDNHSFALLQDNAPWWLLTHYPEANDVFTWFDGLLILAYIGAAALLLGGWIALWLRLSAACLRGSGAQARRIAYALIPLAGAGLFLGLSSLTVAQIKAEGIALPWLPYARGTLLALGIAGSIALAYRQLAGWPSLLRGAALAAFSVATVPVAVSWIALFYFW
ncbi:MAG: 4Fe-4S binding protein [Burkholderiales bacterium]